MHACMFVDDRLLVFYFFSRFKGRRRSDIWPQIFFTIDPGDVQISNSICRLGAIYKVM